MVERLRWLALSARVVVLDAGRLTPQVVEDAMWETLIA
jgi:hypothetical protein